MVVGITSQKVWSSQPLRGHYVANPNNALLQGKSLKITTHLHYHSPKMGNSMTHCLSLWKITSQSK